MDDLSNRLSDMLSDPETVNKLKSMAEMLGIGGNEESGGQAEASGNDGGQGFDLSALSAMLGGSGGSPNNSAPSSPPAQQDSISDLLGGLDIGMLLRMKNALQNTGKNDKNVSLLQAIKPHLSEGRQPKVDEAVKIMRLISLLPLIKESGLFGGNGN